MIEEKLKAKKIFEFLLLMIFGLIAAARLMQSTVYVYT